MGVGSSAGRPNGSQRSERGTGGREGPAAAACWIRLCVSSSSSSSRAKVDTAAWEAAGLSRRCGRAAALASERTSCKKILMAEVS